LWVFFFLCVSLKKKEEGNRKSAKFAFPVGRSRGANFLGNLRRDEFRQPEMSQEIGEKIRVARDSTLDGASQRRTMKIPRCAKAAQSKYKQAFGNVVLCYMVLMLLVCSDIYFTSSRVTTNTTFSMMLHANAMTVSTFTAMSPHPGSLLFTVGSCIPSVMVMVWGSYWDQMMCLMEFNGFRACSLDDTILLLPLHVWSVALITISALWYLEKRRETFRFPRTVQKLASASYHMQNDVYYTRLFEVE
jgi:hypothetical protein